MRILRPAIVASVVLVTAGAASAQIDNRALTPFETAVACAPPASLQKPEGAARRVLGAQDTVARDVYGQNDLLIVDGGTNAGVQLGQEFFVRRAIVAGTASGPRGAVTLGWIRVVAVNDSTAIASVEHFCDAISRLDYLEPYTPPSVSADLERDDASGELDFGSLGRVLSGSENREVAGRGDWLMIDRGTDQGVAPGARFAVYRDMHSDGLPLASVAEGVVISTAKTTSVARITRARDAVASGDYVVPRK
jgi:hypothetical protein